MLFCGSKSFALSFQKRTLSRSILVPSLNRFHALPSPILKSPFRLMSTKTSEENSTEADLLFSPPEGPKGKPNKSIFFSTRINPRTTLDNFIMFSAIYSAYDVRKLMTQFITSWFQRKPLDKKLLCIYFSLFSSERYDTKQELHFRMNVDLFLKAIANITMTPVTDFGTKSELENNFDIFFDTVWLNLRKSLPVSPEITTVEQVYEFLLKMSSISSQTDPNAVMQTKVVLLGSFIKRLASQFTVFTLIGLLMKKPCEIRARSFIQFFAAGLWEAEQLQDQFTKRELNVLLLDLYLKSNSFEHFLERVIDHKEYLSKQHSNLSIDNFNGCMLSESVLHTNALASIKESFVCEMKYDGMRLLLQYNKHNTQNPVVLYSRSGEDVSKQFPSISNAFLESTLAKTVDSIILDGEVVAVDESGNILDFIQIMKRPKDSSKKVKTIAPSKEQFIVFDMIYCNGNSLEKQSLQERRNQVETLLKEASIPQIQFTEYVIIEDTLSVEEKLQKINSFLDYSIAKNCEGIMAKNLASTYAIKGRSTQWKKLKPFYNTADTLDLIPIGALYRSESGSSDLGSYVLASYNPEKQVYETVCKVGTGFSQETRNELNQLLLQSIAFRNEKPDNYVVSSSLKVDVWFEPKYVFEIKAMSFSHSSTHTCNMQGNKKTGISVRFPVFLKLRTDKLPQDATTTQRIQYLASLSSKKPTTHSNAKI